MSEDKRPNVGIVGLGLYLPETKMTAKEISEATGGVWSEEAVIEKLGIREKYIPSDQPCDGTQEMGALAALDCLKNTGIDPMEIDGILCVGEEWKEHPLTTSACYIQDRIGAYNAWAIDIQNRCCSTVSAMQIAKDMMMGCDDCQTVLIAGGYRNCDFIDYTDSGVSFMFDLGAGGAAMILRKNYDKNLILGSQLMANGSIVHTCGSQVGGIAEPVTKDNIDQFGMLRVMDSAKMKDLLNRESMPNWYHCIDEALRKSGLTRDDLGYLDILHMKRSGHLGMLKELGMTEDQSIYLENYGHIGQLDQILSLKLALDEGKVTDGTVIAMVAAGIGYTWAVSIVKWGDA
ncbi:MAG: 3-oxoacyl-ACP synthase [Atopobiaceae bacterium]|nr:3-oxoacyl-ACP synthase [Atopobiaceae bacterium]